MHHTPTHTTHTILRIGASFCPPWGWSTSVECVCYCVELVTPSHTFSSYVPSYALHFHKHVHHIINRFGVMLCPTPSAFALRSQLIYSHTFIMSY